MRSCVTISLVPEARGGPFVFWDDLSKSCAEAAQLGFDAVEIFPPGPERISDGELARLLKSHGLKLAAVGTGAGWVRHGLTLTDVSADKRRAAIDFIRSIIEAAAPFGAPTIVGSMQGRHTAQVDRPTAMNYLRDAFQELGELAGKLGTRLLYEPLNRYETNLCNTLSAACEFARACGPNIAILADLFHMNIEETNSAEALTAAGKLVGHVHFVDSNRRPVGCGQTHFGPIVESLKQMQYDGYLSAEAFAWPDSSQAALQTITVYRSLLASG